MKKLLLSAIITVLGLACCVPTFAEDVIDDVRKEDSKEENRVDPCLNGHVFEWVKTTYHPATCTEDSYWDTVSTCIYCGITKAEYEGDGCTYTDTTYGERERLGHLYTITCNTPETCTEAGEYTRTCSRCGYVDTVIKPATGHIHVETVFDKVLKEATCTEEGIECDYSVCIDCGEYVWYRECRRTLSHDYKWVTTEITPTSCTEDGCYKLESTCTMCGDVNEKVTYYKYYDKYNHYSTGLFGKVNATCTEEGYTGDTYCYVCNKIISYGEDIPALGHDYTEVRVEPTCTEDGYITYTCTRCGDTYTTTLPATGHEWSSIVYTEHPTEWKTILSRSCHKCGYTETASWDW